MDVSALLQAWGQAWQGVKSSPLMSWLEPSVAVRWVHADGGAQLWRARGDRYRLEKERLAAQFVAMELPEDMVLRRQLSMPRMSDAQMRGAAGLEAIGNSPFAVEDLAWGWRPSALKRGNSTSVQVEIILASRRQIESFLHANGSGEKAEVWCADSQGQPVVFQGFGEGRRYGAAAKLRKMHVALAGLSGALLLCLALTPVLQLRAKVLQADAAYQRLMQETKPAVRQRESLVLTEQQLTELRALLAEGVTPLPILEMLTEAMPDDTTLLTLQLQGAKITMTGQTGNAAALIQTLSSQPMLREVRAPSAATRPAGATKDSFSIEALVATPVKQAVVAANDTQQFASEKDSQTTPAAEPTAHPSSSKPAAKEGL